MNKLLSRVVVGLGTGILINELEQKTEQFEATAEQLATISMDIKCDVEDVEEREQVKDMRKIVIKGVCGIIVGCAVGQVVGAIMGYE